MSRYSRYKRLRASWRPKFSEVGCVVIADINESSGREVASSLGDAGHFVKLDVTDEAQWVAAIEETLAHFGKLNIMLQSAGIGLGKPVTEIAPPIMNSPLTSPRKRGPMRPTRRFSCRTTDGGRPMPF